MPYQPGGQSSALAQHQQLHPFEGGIPGLGFFRNPGRVAETALNLHPTFQMPTGDLSEMFDTSSVSRTGALAALSEGLGTFNVNAEGGRDQQGFVSLERWQQAAKQHSSSGMWGSHEIAQAQSNIGMGRQQDVKGKMTLGLVPITGMDTSKGQQQQRPTPSWQHSNPPENSGLHFEQQPEQNYWNNSGGWPSMDSQAYQSSGGGQAL